MGPLRRDRRWRFEQGVVTSCQRPSGCQEAGCPAALQDGPGWGEQSQCGLPGCERVKKAWSGQRVPLTGQGEPGVWQKEARAPGDLCRRNPSFSPGSEAAEGCLGQVETGYRAPGFGPRCSPFSPHFPSLQTPQRRLAQLQDPAACSRPAQQRAPEQSSGGLGGERRGAGNIGPCARLRGVQGSIFLRPGCVRISVHQRGCM